MSEFRERAAISIAAAALAEGTAKPNTSNTAPPGFIIEDALHLAQSLADAACIKWRHEWTHDRIATNRGYLFQCARCGAEQMEAPR